ncbi:DUF2511 domain-containing protein [Kitasatospora paranensis]|uniref:DUF2511 domain-containing protein n=1 Tax=Kitasatospora paranensis TaxID=258053 RepID=A0ABW2FLP9_9ACTN
MARVDRAVRRPAPAYRTAVIGAAVVVVLGAGGWFFLSEDGHSRSVSASSVSPWPFTVGSGTLRCRSGSLLTFASGGTEYGLDATAQDAGYAAPLPVWAAAPGGGGLHMDLRPAIDAARALC